MPYNCHDFNVDDSSCDFCLNYKKSLQLGETAGSMRVYVCLCGESKFSDLTLIIVTKNCLMTKNEFK